MNAHGKATNSPKKYMGCPEDAVVDLLVHGATPPRQRRGRERQRALIEAGLRLTAERDWDDVTIVDIASEIGCSVGTFYTRFRDKDTYFDALLDLMVGAVLRAADAFCAEPERESESTGEFIARWVNLSVNSFRLHRGLYATGLLGLRRLAPAERAASPLIRLRDHGRELFLAMMSRHPGWEAEAMRPQLLFAHQMLRSALINAALTNGGPLHLDDAGYIVELTNVMCRYLGILPPEWPGRSAP